MAPVCRALARCPDIHHVLISTGQHRSLLDQVLAYFDLTPDVDMDLMGKSRNLNELSAQVLQGMDTLLQQYAPRLLLVQGDTTTAFTASLAAFQAGVAVGHVEAGLRSGDLLNPYPEEANRRFISTFASLHFAPTSLARQRLLAEHIPGDAVIVTGNTVVDALAGISGKIGGLPESLSSRLSPGKRLVLVTAHRRESWGIPMQNICKAVREIVRRFKDVEVVFPVHKNPRVREMAIPILDGQPRIHLIEPLDYFEFISTMKHAALILSDSGGVQEEAPSFGVPVLIMRTTTERPEVLSTGRAALVGTDTHTIVRHATEQLTQTEQPGAPRCPNPFGDGRASERILQSILSWHRGQIPYLTKDQEFHSASCHENSNTTVICEAC